MLNGLDRMLGMIDQLEGATKENRRPSHEMCDGLQTEVTMIDATIRSSRSSPARSS